MQCHSYRRKVYTPLVSRTSCRVEPVRVCNITKVMLYFLRVVGLFLRFMLTIVLLSRPYQNPDYRQSKKKRDSGRLPNTTFSRNPFISLLLTEELPSQHQPGKSGFFFYLQRKSSRRNFSKLRNSDLSHHRAYRSVHGGSIHLTSDAPFGVVI